LMTSLRTKARSVSRWKFKFVVVTALLLLVAAIGCNDGSPPPLEGPDRHALGSADAAVTLVAFDDYQ
jgi:hypothetical protein